MTNTENVKKPAKTPRVDMPCQPAAVRAHNFKEVALGYSLEQAQLRMEANTAKVARNTLLPQAAMPAEAATRFCSAMPKENSRSGKYLPY